ncbi:hypothetical protein [Microbacterium album]|uniref:Uncharacterized protein n=1 Tax=Microbacterium album TaxID=2053191 RepID=A0A917MK46_9MICO|nr:hypothetical protein [Microbacterium album]GGH34145.1 hypothetical protein GCM10010921_01630 [Microbacterium album]
MNTIHKVDVVIAEGAPDTTTTVPDSGQPSEPEQVDVVPDPRRRIIVLAPTKQAGNDEARAAGIEPVAVVTPRSLHAARGITADELWDAPSLTPEDRETLLPHVLPSIATHKGE